MGQTTGGERSGNSSRGPGTIEPRDFHWLRAEWPLLPRHSDRLIIWGLDPSTYCCGIAMLCSYGASFTTTIRPCIEKNANWLARGLGMYKRLLTLTELVTWPFKGKYTTKIVGVEVPAVYSRQGDTAVKLGDIRGMLMMVFGLKPTQQGYIIYPDIRPLSAKHALTGDGWATKAKMIEKLTEAWVKMPEDWEADEADALGVALAAYNRYKESQR